MDLRAIVRARKSLKVHFKAVREHGIATYQTSVSSQALFDLSRLIWEHFSNLKTSAPLGAWNEHPVPEHGVDRRSWREVMVVQDDLQWTTQRGGLGGGVKIDGNCLALGRIDEGEGAESFVFWKVGPPQSEDSAKQRSSVHPGMELELAFVARVDKKLAAEDYAYSFRGGDPQDEDWLACLAWLTCMSALLLPAAVTLNSVHREARVLHGGAEHVSPLVQTSLASPVATLIAEYEMYLRIGLRRLLAVVYGELEEDDLLDRAASRISDQRGTVLDALRRRREQEFRPDPSLWAYLTHFQYEMIFRFGEHRKSMASIWPDVDPDELFTVMEGVRRIRNSAMHLRAEFSSEDAEVLASSVKQIRAMLLD